MSVEYTLYGLKRPDETTVRYIGITCRLLSRRLSLHRCQKGINPHKDHWIEKMKPLKPEIVPYAVGLSFEEACDLEIFVIRELREAGFDLLNVSPGGDAPLAGQKRPEGFCKKLSESRKGPGNPMFGKIPWNKGRNMNPEQMESLRRGNIGRKHSEESKKKRSIFSIGRKHTEQSRFKMSQIARARENSTNGVSMLGRKHSEETKRKISETKLGKKLSPQ